MPRIAAFPAATQERLATPVADIMRPGVITMAEGASLLQAKRAMVRHGVHAILIVGEGDGKALGWVSADGLLAWLVRDLSAVPASQASPSRRGASTPTRRPATRSRRCSTPASHTSW